MLQYSQEDNVLTIKGPKLETKEFQYSVKNCCWTDEQLVVELWRKPKKKKTVKKQKKGKPLTPEKKKITKIT